jgi:hypothetical protein
VTSLSRWHRSGAPSRSTQGKGRWFPYLCQQLALSAHYHPQRRSWQFQLRRTSRNAGTGEARRSKPHRPRLATPRLAGSWSIRPPCSAPCPVSSEAPRRRHPGHTRGNPRGAGEPIHGQAASGQSLRPAPGRYHPARDPSHVDRRAEAITLCRRVASFARGKVERQSVAFALAIAKSRSTLHQQKWGTDNELG